MRIFASAGVIASPFKLHHPGIHELTDGTFAQIEASKLVRSLRETPPELIGRSTSFTDEHAPRRLRHPLGDILAVLP